MSNEPASLLLAPEKPNGYDCSPYELLAILGSEHRSGRFGAKPDRTGKYMAGSGSKHRPFRRGFRRVLALFAINKKGLTEAAGSK